MTAQHLSSMLVHSAAPSAAGAVPRVAAACDDGCVRVFAAEPGRPGLAYARSTPAVAGRAVSVAWHPGGGCLVAGTSQGTLHAWDIAASRELLRITVGVLHQRRPWCAIPVRKTQGDGSGRKHCIEASCVSVGHDGKSLE